jgi:hypothetical protein
MRRRIRHWPWLEQLSPAFGHKLLRCAFSSGLPVCVASANGLGRAHQIGAIDLQSGFIVVGASVVWELR